MRVKPALSALALTALALAAAGPAGAVLIDKWEVTGPAGFLPAADATVNPNPTTIGQSTQQGYFIVFDINNWNTLNPVQILFEDKTPQGQADAQEHLHVRFAIKNTTTKPWLGFRFRMIDGNNTHKAVPGDLQGDNLFHPQHAHKHIDFAQNVGFTKIAIQDPSAYVNDFDESRGIYQMTLFSGFQVAPNQTWSWQYLDLHDKIKSQDGTNITKFTFELLPLLQAVPEPSTGLLLGGGLLVLAGTRRRARGLRPDPAA